MDILKRLYTRSKVLRWLFGISHLFVSIIHSLSLSRINAEKNKKLRHRQLEIGPGMTPLPGFETLNVRYSRGVTYVGNASGRLGFPDDTFDEIFASHVLEHIPWYKAETVLSEWLRVLKPGGRLTIWVPDGYKIAKAWVDFEDKSDASGMRRDGWYKFNEKESVVKWANGRLFSYGDGVGTLGHPNWHLAVFSESYLHDILNDLGFSSITTLSANDRLGKGHGWVEIGVSGRK